MTCYQRHMGWLFDEIGLPYEKQERKLVDGALRELLGVSAELRCPAVGAAIKALDDEQRAALPAQVAQKLGL